MFLLFGGCCSAGFFIVGFVNRFFFTLAFGIERRLFENFVDEFGEWIYSGCIFVSLFLRVVGVFFGSRFFLGLGYFVVSGSWVERVVFKFF